MAFEQVTDPMGSAEIANTGKDPKIISTYMWGRWIRNFIVVPLVAGLGLLIIQARDTLSSNAETNRINADTLASIHDFSVSEPGSWQLSDDGEYLEVTVLAPALYKHLIDSGWVQMDTLYFKIMSTELDETTNRVLRLDSPWIGTSMPAVVDNKITFTVSTGIIPPNGALTSQAKYSLTFKTTLSSPGGRVQRYFRINVGSYTAP